MTPEEAREAIAGKRRLSVFFTDSPLAVRMKRVSERAANPLLPSDQGEHLALTGDVQHLPRGAYDLPTFDGQQQPAVVLHLAEHAGVAPPKGLGFLYVVVEADGVRYLLHERASVLAEARPARGLPPGAIVEPAKSTETPAMTRRRERYEMCLQAGLKMPDNPAATLPRGVGAVAKKCRVSRPTFTDDVKAHIARLHEEKQRNGRRTEGS